MKTMTFSRCKSWSSCFSMSGPDTLKREHQLAFTVIELLVVIAIIGALTALSVPAIRTMTQSNTASNASRQLMDDLALARQYAINNRSVVHVLFVPPSITNMTFPNPTELTKRLMTGIYTTYAIYAERTVGDQPGQPRARYLSKWKSLPDGMLIDVNEFNVISFKDWDAKSIPDGRPFLYWHNKGFPFPTITNALVMLPHIAFDAQGSVIVVDPKDGTRKYRARDEVIGLARGSILAPRDEINGNLLSFDVRTNVTDSYIRIRIDGLTGRSTLERPSL